MNPHGVSGGVMQSEAGGFKARQVLQSISQIAEEVCYVSMVDHKVGHLH
jgi:hypothetical protein